MPSAPAAGSTRVSSSRPRAARCWSIAVPPRWSRSRPTASIRFASMASCCRICTAIISARFRSCCSTRQFLAQRERPLLIAGPPGTRTRSMRRSRCSFRAPPEQVAVFVEGDGDRGRPGDRRWDTAPTTEVVHYSGAPSTALRLSDGKALFAYSGDTEWIDALICVADGADLFIVECYGYSGHMTGHLSWEVLKPRLPDLRARRVMLTHMNPVMLAHVDEARAAGPVGRGGRRADRVLNGRLRRLAGRRKARGNPD